MVRINARGLIVATVGALLILAGGREASAGLSVSGGIVVVGGGGQGTDPPYDYEFRIDLSGSILPALSWVGGSLEFTPTYLTVDNLVGVSAGSSTFTMDVPVFAGWTVVSISPDQHTGLPDVTWLYTGFGATISSPPASPLLGIVGIETTTSYDSGYPAPLPTSVGYTYILNGGPSMGGSTSSGMVGLQQGGFAAPEPSTLIAPLVVLLGLPLSRLFKRRVGRNQQTGLNS